MNSLLCVHFNWTFSPAWQNFMTCNVNDEAEIVAKKPVTAVFPFLLDEQPPPFQCRPGSDPAGYWDETTQTLNDAEFPNSNGQISIEACYFWGRGAMLTRGSVSLALFPFLFVFRCLK